MDIAIKLAHDKLPDITDVEINRAMDAIELDEIASEEDDLDLEDSEDEAL